MTGFRENAANSEYIIIMMIYFINNDMELFDRAYVLRSLDRLAGFPFQLVHAKDYFRAQDVFPCRRDRCHSRSGLGPNAPAAQGGAVGGAASGAVGGAIVGDQTPRFQTDVVEHRRPSYTYAEPVIVGATLPNEGVVYCDVPREYGETRYRYTVVNNRTVLVDPRTGRIVQVIQ